MMVLPTNQEEMDIMRTYTLTFEGRPYTVEAHNFFTACQMVADLVIHPLAR